MEESLTIKVAHRPFRVKLCTFMKIVPGMVRIGISLTVLGKIPSMMLVSSKKNLVEFGEEDTLVEQFIVVFAEVSL